MLIQLPMLMCYLFFVYIYIYMIFQVEACGGQAEPVSTRLVSGTSSGAALTPLRQVLV